MKLDIVCFSHLRWNFVYQRPQHLLSRFSKNSRVFFIEEPIWDAGIETVSIKQVADNITVVVPYLLSDNKPKNLVSFQREMLDKLLDDMNITDYIFWYYSPMALPLSKHADPALIIYDCMDELSSFKNAPEELKLNEAELIRKADIMFTGGRTLYHAKKHLHHNVHVFPSSIDKEHFFAARAKTSKDELHDQIPHPRFGFYGVLDERFNMELLANVANKNPQWSFVLVGPVVKINEDSIPSLGNVHYLGIRSYKDLPSYLAEWDVAIMPFALNEATRYISPTKTPEFLAAGKPVISTSISDVVEPYGNKGLVSIADTADEFTEAGERILNTILADGHSYEKWLGKVDNFLHGMSWDKTWRDMLNIMDVTMQQKTIKNLRKTEIYV
jgi:glycosyltransferase involved in cell wall biosynthesis